MVGPAPNALHALGRLLRPYRWVVVGLSLLIALSAALAQVTPQFVRFVIDTVIPDGRPRLFLLTGAAMAVFYVINEALSYAAMYMSYDFTQRVIKDVRANAYRHLLSLPMSRFTAERSGSLVSRVVSDVNALESMIQAGATRIVGQLFSIVVVTAILFAMNWLLALISLAVVTIMTFFTVYFQGPLRILARQIRGRVGEMTAVASEAIGNISVVKMFTGESSEYRRFETESSRYRKLNLERRRQVGYMQAGVGISAEMGVGALVLVGGWIIAQGGGAGAAGLTTGELTAFLLYLNNLVGPVRLVLNFNNVLQAGVAALDRVDELLDEDPEAGGVSQEFEGGEIRFHAVHFRYPGAASAGWALAGLDLRIPAGRTVALVGPSGAGKTTVGRLLSRLYDPQEGTIAVGRRDLREFRLDTVRRAVAVVPQEPTLFSGSVRENIRYARPEAEDHEVRRAAELANAATFIEALPSGFETEIGERGVKLSGGQKQRVAIARAILKGASILVLDEATSSLDSESESVIQDALAGYFSRRQELTSIVIAHRLSTIRDADRIFVMQDGRVVESGSHDELLGKPGLYRRLFEIQTSGPVTR
ncbi:MAG: ABC transporter ATP-binding protein [Trueperaceae bacterium]